MSECKYCNNPLIEPLHIQKGFHVSCQQKKDREEMDAAVKNLAANKAPNASFVQGGQTGMRQTNVKNYPKKNIEEIIFTPALKIPLKLNINILISSS